MRDEIKMIMARVFSVKQESITDDIAYGINENWDSIHHLNLIVELESFYHIIFEPEEIQSMITLDKIIDCIKSKQ